MYHNLNIPCSFSPDGASVDKLKLILSQLSQFNECTAALNYTIQDLKKVKKANDFDRLGINSKYPLTILKRLTIDTDTIFNNEDIASLRQDYDLISLKTRNDELFELACKELNLDMISFHFDERLSFELKPLLIKRAMERHVYFEISYAPTIKDKQARLYTLQIAKELYEFTKGHYWIISSETESVSDIRNPYDIFYL
ncbi:unnamed protein product [Rhizopus stolonifer]